LDKPFLAVNHDGDSDSTGSITGNLLGAMKGIKSIPDEWPSKLELKAVITEIANDLYSFSNWKISEYSEDHASEESWKRYPGY
jgi:hypothetical protein